MPLLDLSVRMRPVTRISADPFEHPGAEIGIALKPFKAGSIPNIDPTHTWCWAVVQKTPGQEDKFLVGSTTDSQTGAAAAAFEAFKELEEKWLRTKAGPALSLILNPKPEG